jgi:outer membrane protein
MKKLLFVSILICSSFNVFAQKEEEKTKPTDKGHFIVDGSIFFSTNNSKSEQGGFKTKSEAFGFGISPKAGYFIADRFALGLETSFGYTDNEFTNTDGTKSSGNSTAISVGPFVRYYLVNGIFGQASLGFGTSNSESNGFENKNDFFNYQLGVGYAIFLNQHISLEPIISYSYSKNKSDQSIFETTNNGFTLGAGFTIYL